ncbi:MAG: hypothetical protein QFB86_04520, partial [Patescibacteria group bacterium]|nr:hypothetical protein [Patescibacteria group bacterium]
VVNMRLLKRAADESKKHLVLITSEAGLLPLAGLAGVHVAKTLTSKPEIPMGPGIDDDEESIQEDGGEAEELPPEAGETPVGELAGLGAAGAAATTLRNDDDVETVSLDDDDDTAELAAAGAAAGATSKSFTPPKKNKKLAVPNFEKFRLLLVLGVLAVLLLIGGAIAALSILPKATISIKTDATNINSDLGLNLSTAATTLKPSNNTLPAKLASQQKTYTQQVTSTGQKNNGNRASGSVTVTNCTDADITVPGGTGFSANGNTYISQQTADVPASNFKSNGTCKNDGKAQVDVIAQNGGTAFNIPAGANFSIANNPGKLTAVGGTIAGGTDSIVQVVTQTDIESAKSKITPNDTSMKQTLMSQLKGDELYAIEATYLASSPVVTTSAKAGDPASTVTATETITYTMFGVHESDLKTLVEADIKKQIDSEKQSILDNGIKSANYNVTSATATNAVVTMSVTATAGPDLNIDEIKQQAAGKKPADVRAALQGNPDVTDIDVKLSPFFVSSIPKKIEKITVVIAKPTITKPSNTDASNP